MTSHALDPSKFPMIERTTLRVGPQIITRLFNERKELMTKAARQMADLLEQQSELLADLGMQRVAQDACKEARQLRLLAALEG